MVFSPFSIATTSLWEERAGLCVFRAFPCFAHVSLCLIRLPLGVKDWLRLVTVAFPGLFFLPFSRIFEKIFKIDSLFNVRSDPPLCS